MTTKNLVTIGTIARETGISLPTINYILRSRKIEPLGRAGQFRVYDLETIKKIKAIHESIRRV